MVLAALLVSITFYYSHSPSFTPRAQSAGDPTHLPSLPPGPTSSMGPCRVEYSSWESQTQKPTALTIFLPSTSECSAFIFGAQIHLPFLAAHVYSLLRGLHVLSQHFLKIHSCSNIYQVFSCIFLAGLWEHRKWDMELVHVVPVGVTESGKVQLLPFRTCHQSWPRIPLLPWLRCSITHLDIILHSTKITHVASIPLFVHIL